MQQRNAKGKHSPVLRFTFLGRGWDAAMQCSGHLDAALSYPTLRGDRRPFRIYVALRE